MRKTIILLISVLFLSGCATLDSIRLVNRERLLQLSIGMTKQEVLKIMGTKRETDGFQTINNPYRSETLQGKDKTFEVLYYYTDKKKADDAITDDELTPLVFEEGKLVGWGWGFLQENIQKYEIRWR
jgi:outer membrane protein assembly factor BamE (lipoprotein component of BamABCDE complex)